jgi:hypothetical protein
VAVAVAAALAWTAVVGFGVVQLSASWSVLAGIAGLIALGLAIRGYPLVGIAGLLAAVACWGFVTRPVVPASFSDVVGVLRLVGENLAFAGPLLIAFLAAMWVDGRRAAVAAVRAALAQRWVGINRGDPEPQLPALEEIPAARFYALPDGRRCSHAVAAGKRVALVGSTVWPRGQYTLRRHEIQRNERSYVPGTGDVDAVFEDLRAWTARLASANATCQAFLVVHPASERLTDAVRIELPQLDGVHVLPAEKFAEDVGAFLAVQPNRIDIALTELLLKALPASVDLEPETTSYRVGAQPGIG